MSAIVLSLLGWPAFLRAESTNGIVTLIQDTLASVGAEAESGNSVSLLFSAGQPSGGDVINGAFAIMAGYPTESPPWPPGARTILVTGAVDDPTASVVVNGIPATVSSGTFSAAAPLVEGPNPITAVLTDPAGNSSSVSITVTLNTQPPPRPTVWTSLAVTTASSYPLSGTKTPGTSIWINGVEVVPLNDATTWSATVTLVEGDNILRIVAKNAPGNVSASATANIIVDNLPPVITLAPTTPAKTNLTQFTLTGTVDDSLTRVEVNGIAATRSARSFEVAVPLTLGVNSLHLIAVSPNGYTTTTDDLLTLGTIPTIQTVAPIDGTLLYMGSVVTVQMSAVDQEHDPLAYQILLDGVPLSEWSSQPSVAWTPRSSQLGLHTLTYAVRDDYGGSKSERDEVLVIRNPIQHP